MSSTNLINGRPTIAVLTNMMATPFAQGIIFGASDYAKLHNYNIICFSGAEFAKEAPINMSRHRIFELIASSFIDGVMLPMGALSRFIDLDEQLQFLNQFSHVPVVTIASDIPGYLNVGYSPQQGMFELVDHLVQQHQIKRFSFAGATGVHRSSLVKKAFFIEALNLHQIEYDEGNNITSDMRRNAPMEGLESLFSKHKSQWPQAIVASTDNQAKDIITALKLINVHVPQDVIVTGSMGHVDSLFAEPPLTSIVEPTYELGWFGAERLIAAIEGRPFTQNLEIPTSLVIRRSCGCNQPGYCPDINTEVTLNQSGLSLTLDDIRHELTNLLDNVTPELRNFISAPTSEHIAHLTLRALAYHESQPLLNYFHQQLELSLKTEANYIWGQIAQCVHRIVMRHIDPTTSAENESPLAIALFGIVQTCNEKAGHYREFQSQKYVGLMREIGIQLNSEFDLNEISTLLSHGLDISECFINIFEELNQPVRLSSSVLAMQQGKRIKVSSSPFPSSQLIPPDAIPYGEAFSFIVMPLSFKQDFIGFCVFGMGERKGVVYEGLLTLFSSALKNQLHVKSLLEAEAKFSDIAHSASDWLWEIDSQTHFTYCSDGVAQVLGYAPETLVGCPIIDYLANPNHLAVAQLVQSMRAEHGAVAHESLYRHKNGSLRTLLATGKAVIKSGKIVGYRGAYKDISDIKAQEDRIRTLAYYDPLTHLVNRTLFNDRLNTIVGESKTNGGQFAVLFVDLDGFKLVNDSLGHDAGDLLLCEVAELFSKCVTEFDTLARFGGDEFVVLLPHIDDNEEAKQVANQLIDTLSSPIKIRNQAFYVTASIGISIYPTHGDTAETLLVNADKAMYRAKQNGRNRCGFYEPKLEDELNRMVTVCNLLHSSLQTGNFTLLYQPLLNATTRKVCGVEALIRMVPKSEGDPIIGPDEFIPVAEDIGLIDKIGLWVFQTSCQQLDKWSSLGLNIKCSVNISAKQFRNPNIGDQLIKIIEAADINPEWITIEITENAVIDNEIKARAILHQLSEYGVKIAIDDFGTGYASLSCLRKIPVDIIKIDRSFVNDCITNTENANIISAIVMMAKSLKLQIVAEGVETQQQSTFLENLGCDKLQGYLFSKPLSEQQLVKFLNNTID
jgi:diguanylate cyclase (GGDEF)-like protein/PAS domain S-box-containing protein